MFLIDWIHFVAFSIKEQESNPKDKRFNLLVQRLDLKYLFIPLAIRFSKIEI